MWRSPTAVFTDRSHTTPTPRFDWTLISYRSIAPPRSHIRDGGTSESWPADIRVSFWSRVNECEFLRYRLACKLHKLMNTCARYFWYIDMVRCLLCYASVLIAADAYCIVSPRAQLVYIQFPCRESWLRSFSCCGIFWRSGPHSYLKTILTAYIKHPNKIELKYVYFHQGGGKFLQVSGGFGLLLPPDGFYFQPSVSVSAFWVSMTCKNMNGFRWNL